MGGIRAYSFMSLRPADNRVPRVAAIHHNPSHTFYLLSPVNRLEGAVYYEKIGNSSTVSVAATLADAARFTPARPPVFICGETI